MLLHRIDDLNPTFASRILPFLKYLCFKIYDTKESGCLMTLRSCFASITLLKASKFLKPNSPHALDSQKKFPFSPMDASFFLFMVPPKFGHDRVHFFAKFLR